MAWTAPRTWTDGELVSAAIMNPHVRDNQLAEGPHLIVRKTSDQSVTSSTAFVSDTALQLPVAANEVWLFRFILRWEAASAGDIQIAWSLPAGSQVDAGASMPGDAIFSYQSAWWRAIVTTDSAPLVFGGAGAGQVTMQFIDGVYTGAGTAGTLILRWTQGTSSATATKVLTNSTLWAVKLA